MKIAIILCTHNRVRRLEGTLRAVLAQDVRGAAWEVVVVADACSDDTPGMVRARAATAAVPLRLLDAGFRSLSRARNLGAEQAAGDMLVFLDDDAVPAPGWLAAYAEFFRRHPEFRAGGGPIEVDWSETPKPAWWRTAFDVNLGGLQLAADAVEFPPGTFPFGGNMYLSAAAFREVGPFDPNLGMKGKAVYLGEETDWFMRHAAKGGHAGYVSGALVHHWANPVKATRRSLLLRSWRAGQAVAALPGDAADTRGWLAWLRHSASAIVRGRLSLSEMIYLVNWLGRLQGRSAAGAKTK
jgi:glucosyl-dolichyl phosphate glucuronosyltransferase